MLRVLITACIGAALIGGAPATTDAQTVPDWSPPSSEMPAMPPASAADGAWMGTVSGWFRGLDRVSELSTSNLRVMPEGAGRDGRALYIRFQSGHLPVAAWSDRSGDGRVDLIEIFRNGRAVIQVIDSDYSGRANVMRIYNANGTLDRERRL